MNPATSGNRLTKGNCCGGYNRFNEDYIWSMYENGYSKFQVQSIVPFTISSLTSWDGITPNGNEILHGTFVFDYDSTQVIRCLNPDGTLSVIHEARNNTFEGSVIQIDWSGGDVTKGWHFHGWKINLQGALTEDGFPIQFAKYKTRGGIDEFPQAINFDSDDLLQALSSVKSISADNIRLYAGVNSVKFSFEMEAFYLDGEPIDQPLAYFQQLIRWSSGFSGTISVDQVYVSDTTGQWVLKCSLTNIGGDGAVEFAEHLRYTVDASLGSDDTKKVSGLQLKDDGNYIEDSVCVDCPFGETKSGGLPALAVNRVNAATGSVSYEIINGDPTFDVKLSTYLSLGVTIGTATTGTNTYNPSFDFTVSNALDPFSDTFATLEIINQIP